MGHPARGAESAIASRGVGGQTALSCLERARSSHPETPTPTTTAPASGEVLLKTKTRTTVLLRGQIERLMRNECGRGHGIGVYRALPDLVKATSRSVSMAR